MLRTLLAPLTAASLLAGCAGREEVATLAGQSSAVLNDYKREMSAFARRQTSLSQDNARRIADLGQIRERQQMVIDRRLRGWRLADDKDALAMYADATSEGADQILAASETIRGAGSSPNQIATVKFDAGQIEAVIKQLKALERSPTFWDNIVFAVSYNDQLRAAYKKSLEDAATDAEDAGDAAAQITNAIVSGD